VYAKPNKQKQAWLAEQKRKDAEIEQAYAAYQPKQVFHQDTMTGQGSQPAFTAAS
jgi:hypothetical protein